MCELINFTQLSSDEAEMILAWRNDERVAKFMKTKFISRESHFKFLQNLKDGGDKRYFLVKDGGYAGVIDFTDITREGCEFGLYANPELKGVGKILMSAVLKYAFEVLDVKELRACAYKGNAAALRLYEKFKLLPCGEDEEFLYLKITQNSYNTAKGNS